MGLNHSPGHLITFGAGVNRPTDIVLAGLEAVAMTTREEHLIWARARALAYVDADDTDQAFASMASDLEKHPETTDHPAIRLGFKMLMSGFLSTKETMRKFIEGIS